MEEFYPGTNLLLCRPFLDEHTNTNLRFRKCRLAFSGIVQRQEIHKLPCSLCLAKHHVREALGSKPCLPAFNFQAIAMLHLLKLFEGGRIRNCIKRQNLTLTHFCSLFSLSVFIFMNSLFEFPSLANLSHRISTTHLLTQNLSAHTFTATQCAALLTSCSLFCS